jgi:hypothetical protein
MSLVHIIERKERKKERKKEKRGGEINLLHLS